MTNSFIEWKNTSYLSSQTGIQVFINENKKVEVSCVERSLFSRIIDSIAHIFGTSSTYGIHLIPETSSIFLELSENLKKDDVSLKILPQIRIFLDEETTSITKDSYAAVLENIAKKANHLKEKIPFLPPPETEKINSNLENENNLPNILNTENSSSSSTEPCEEIKPEDNENNLPNILNTENSSSSSTEPCEEIEPEDNDILKTKSLRNRATDEVPPSKSSKIKKFFLTCGLLLLAGYVGRNMLNADLSAPVYKGPGPVCKAPLPVLTDFAHKPLENDSHPLCSLKEDVDPSNFICAHPHPYLKEIEVVTSAGRNTQGIRWPNHLSYIDGSTYTGRLNIYTARPSGEGVLTGFNGNIVYKGHWNNGIQAEGFGTVLLDDQSLFTGPIRDGTPCGKGIKKSLFGQEEYIASGYGKLPVENNQIFIGDIENHQPSGYGELFSNDGILIKEGIFHENNLIKEIRTISLSNSEFFRGEIDEQGLPDGYGVVYSEKGLFIGKFDHGELIGVRPEEKASPVLLFSSYTPNRVQFNAEVINNHKLYAKEKGYHYVEFVENVAQDLEALATEKPSETLPYWSKIAATIRLLTLLNPQKFPEEFRKHLPQEFVWLDDDAVVTERSIKIEDVVEHYAPQASSTHIFLTQDPGFGLNTAILFVKNTLESRSVFGEIWNRRLKKSNSETYATCANQSCLHEQAALDDLVKLQEYDAKKYVRIIPQRDSTDPVGGWGINTFNRASHFDYDRDLPLDYDGDPKSGRWQSGDFIGQATGMAKNGRRPEDEQPLDLRDLYARQLWLDSK